jgi:hypothetical protein
MLDRARKSTAAFVVAALLFGMAGQAHAEHPVPPRPGGLRGAIAGVFHHEKAAPRTPAEARTALTEAAQASGTPTYVGKNGKVYVNPHNQGHISAIEKLSPEGSGVFALAQFKGTQHTLAVFENRLIHFQTRDWSNWRIRSWGERLRPSGHVMSVAMVQLTPVEAANLRKRVAGMFDEQGQEHAAGGNWEKGHVDTGGRSFNCTAGWCQMRIGEQGESLGEIVGVPHQYDPFAANVNFENHGNERVFGIGIYGPAIPNFGMNTEATQSRPH